MTVGQVIERIDSLMTNTFTKEQKLLWLSKVEWMIKRNIIDTHEAAQKISFNGYDMNTPDSTQLLAPPPYDELYIRWLEAQMHLAYREEGKHNAAIILYNAEYAAFEDYYNRTHAPLQAGRRFLF